MFPFKDRFSFQLIMFFQNFLGLALIDIILRDTVNHFIVASLVYFEKAFEINGHGFLLSCFAVSSSISSESAHNAFDLPRHPC